MAQAGEFQFLWRDVSCAEFRRYNFQSQLIAVQLTLHDNLSCDLWLKQHNLLETLDKFVLHKAYALTQRMANDRQ